MCYLLLKREKADNLQSVTLFSDAFVTPPIIYMTAQIIQRIE